MKIIQLMLTMVAGVLLSSVFMSVNVNASDDTGIPLYDETAYTQSVEKKMHKMHGLYLRAHDSSLSAKDKAKAKREYYAVAQGLVRDMHERVMRLDIKTGAALSHTDIILSNHLTMMLLDMLAAEQLAQ